MDSSEECEVSLNSHECSLSREDEAVSLKDNDEDKLQVNNETRIPSQNQENEAYAASSRGFLARAFIKG